MNILKARSFRLPHVRALSTAQISKANQAPHLNFRSLLSALREQGDLIDVNESVDPNLEVAAVTRRVYEELAPAPLFHNVSGTDPKTGLFKILGAPAALRKDTETRYGRIAIQLGLPVTATAKDIVEKLIEAKNAEPLPPVTVSSSSAPCKENILHGDQIDMTKWPIPRLHTQDGGNFLATYGFHILRSPDDAWTSWSISRTMHIAGTPRSLAAPVQPEQHIAQVHQMWADRGSSDTPWALVLGGPPAAAFVGGMPLPAGVSEDGYIGALSGSPMEVVKCETNNLFVPASSEIVIEGRISTTEKVPEGPMGEYHGYLFQDKPLLRPLFKVDCVTYRKDPVVPISVAGKAPDETHTVWGPAISAELLAALREAEFPVEFVWMPFESQACWIIVSVDVNKLGQMNLTKEELSRRAGEIIFGTHAGWEAPKVFLVGNDVDITDINQVLWALATRYRPGADELVLDDPRGIPMIPYMTRASRKDVPDPGKGGKAVVNLVLPSEFEGIQPWVHSSFEGAYPDDVKEKVLKKWRDYGFD